MNQFFGPLRISTNQRPLHSVFNRCTNTKRHMHVPYYKSIHIWMNYCVYYFFFFFFCWINVIHLAYITSKKVYKIKRNHSTLGSCHKPLYKYLTIKKTSSCHTSAGKQIFNNWCLLAQKSIHDLAWSLPHIKINIQQNCFSYHKPSASGNNQRHHSQKHVWTSLHNSNPS